VPSIARHRLARCDALSHPGGCAACLVRGSSRSPSDAPSKIPATWASRSAPPARELAEFGHRGVLLVPGQLAPSGMVPGSPGELGDEDTVAVRSGTMILIHLNRIELIYDNSKPAGSSPGQAMDIGRQ